MTPTCAQCGESGWSITVGGEPAAPLTLDQMHSIYAETLHFCDTLCLLRWAVEQRENVGKFWQEQWRRSAGDVNHVLHQANFLDRVLISRWWRKRFEAHRSQGGTS